MCMKKFLVKASSRVLKFTMAVLLSVIASGAKNVTKC